MGRRVVLLVLLVVVATAPAWASGEPGTASSSLAFDSPVLHNLRFYPSFVLIRKLNADRYPDVVAAGAPLSGEAEDEIGPGAVVVLFGGPNGALTRKQRLLVETSVTRAALADLDGDEHPDLVVELREASAVLTFKGRPDGTFAAPVRMAVPNTPYEMAVVDVTGDHRAEVLVDMIDPESDSEGSTNLMIANNDGAGHLGPFAAVPAGGRALAFTTGDLNRDQRTDVLVTTTTSKHVTALYGTGNGTFGPPVVIGSAGFATSPQIADLNRDGRRDVILLTNSKLVVLQGAPGGKFRPARAYRVPGYPSDIEVANLNRDRRPDVLVETGQGAAVFVTMPSGRLRLTAHVKVQAIGATQTAFAEVNGDGRRDLLIGDMNSPNVFVIPIARDGRFGAQRVAKSSGRVRNVTAADMDSDGKRDLVIGHSEDPIGISVLLQR